MRIGWNARGGGSARRAVRAIIVAVTVVLAASLSAAGAAQAAQAAQAASAGHGPRTVLGRIASGGGRPVAASASASAPADAEKECFYTVPDCSSTDPTVEFEIVSQGDTSSCTFQYTTDWGDKTSETKSFPGGADGSVGATFTHTYDKSKPATYTVTVTGQTTSGSCSANGGTLQFTLTAAVGVAAVRFAAVGARELTTPGLPVIKDDGSSLTHDRSWRPASCTGIAEPRDFDYVDCGSPLPNGTPDKNWPVIYVAGTALTVNEVVLAANGPVTSPQLTATATVSGPGSASASLTLPATSLTSAKVSDGYQLTASALDFSGTLPTVPGRDELTITWTVTETDSGATIQSGTSKHALYVTAAKYATPSGPGIGEVEAPYETLLDVGTVAAGGKSGARNVFNAIWKKFGSRAIKHPILNPATGQVTYGETFKYYNNDYMKIADWFNKNFGGCPPFETFLRKDSGHCGDWGWFLAGVLAFQGISAGDVALGLAHGFYAGPSPAVPFGNAYMLVGRPGRWSFVKKNLPGNYPYADRLTVAANGQVTVSGSNVRYRSTTVIGQGPVSDPPMMFRTGDHAIDEVRLPGAGTSLYVDPSYGNPQSTVPYPNIPAYEKAAIAGFAVVYKKEGKKLVVLPYGDVSPCRDSTCYFAASSYA